MASVIIAILPMLIILFFAQKYFVKGIQFSGSIDNDRFFL